MTTFLEQENYTAAQIAPVCKLIMATKLFVEPQNFEEQVIKDADTSHFGKDTFFETSETLRKELSLLKKADYTKKKWRNENIKMLQSHRYYTDYAITTWEPGKIANLKKMAKFKKTEKEIEKRESIKAKFKSDSPDRGVQTMYRVTMRNHLKLSDIADTKANILLSVNAIIISLVLSSLLPKLDNPHNAYLIVPTTIYIAFAVASMVLSIMATRPNITQGEFTKKDVENKKVNLLFFGNFHKMPLNEFQWAMNELAKDKDYVHDSLTMDLYFLGKVLHRKYRILRQTYTIFMIGIIFSVISFIIAFYFFGRERLSEELISMVLNNG